MNLAGKITAALDDQWQRPVVETVSLVLPMPPSMNALWRRGGVTGMYRAPRYMTWIRAAGQQLEAQRPGRIVGDYVLALNLERRDNRKRDIDNFFKAVSDLLVLHRVIRDDSLAQSVTAMWSPAVTGCHVVVAQLRLVGAVQ